MQSADVVQILTVVACCWVWAFLLQCMFVWRVRKIAHSDCLLRHVYVCPSVRPHGTTPLPLDGFS
jgi:hypothetical protein